MRVAGTTRTRQGAAVSGLEVSAFDRVLGSKEEAVKGRTSADGRYTIDYTREKFQRAVKRSADVFIEVRPRRKGHPVRLPVHYNAPESLIVDLWLKNGQLRMI